MFEPRLMEAFLANSRSVPRFFSTEPAPDRRHAFTETATHEALSDRSGKTEKTP